MPIRLRLNGPKAGRFGEYNRDKGKSLAAPDNANPVPPIPVQQGGYQANLNDLLKERHAHTASKLAAWVIGIMAFSIILHYGCVLLLVFTKRTDGITVLSDIFHSWLPVVSGLAGAAATYYFTKEK